MCLGLIVKNQGLIEYQVSFVPTSVVSENTPPSYHSQNTRFVLLQGQKTDLRTFCFPMAPFHLEAALFNAFQLTQHEQLKTITSC